MRKNRFGLLGAAAALALAGVLGNAQIQANSAPYQQTRNTNDIKATPPKQQDKKTRFVRQVGGMPLMETGEFGLTPREYGLRFGNGASRKGKKNYLRMAHNAKVSKRISRA